MNTKPQRSPMELVKQWIDQHHPKYADYRMRSMAWEYDVSEIPSEVAVKADKVFRESGEIHGDDLRTVIERVIPPSGYVFITVENDSERVGINVPVSAWMPSAQTPEQKPASYSLSHKGLLAFLHAIAADIEHTDTQERAVAILERLNAAPVTPLLNDHQIAFLVNDLRDIAVNFHGTQQLRDRLSQAVTSALRGKQADADKRDAEIAVLEASCSNLARLVDELRPKAERYDYLRDRDLNAIEEGGVFAGKVPENVVLNGDDLDAAIDTAIKKGGAA